MRLFNLIFLFLGLCAGIAQGQKNTSIPALNFNQFEPYLHRQNDTIYIVNFWASWCIPCREEMPAFEKIREKYADKKLKVLLVSLDFSNQVESRLLPYIRANHIKSQVILLDDPIKTDGLIRWTQNGQVPFHLPKFMARVQGIV